MQISVVRTNPFSLSNKQHLPKIVPRVLTKRKLKHISTTNSSDEDREAVEQLNDWEKRGSLKSLPTSISEAKITLKKRIAGLDIVEDIKFKRKHKSKLPNLSTHAIPLVKSMHLRQLKKEAEESFRERCRYFRLYEEDLKSSREQVMKEIVKIKEKRLMIREQLVMVKKRLTEFHEELESLRENLVQHESAIKTQEEITSWMVKKQQLKEEIKNKELEKQELALEVSREAEIKNKQLGELDWRIKDLKSRSENLRNSLAKHYLELLKEGKDTRSEGLQWIVIALWKLGETLTIEDFPVYLDRDSIHFILFLAQKSMEAEEILSKLIGSSRQIFSSFEKLSNSVESVKQRLVGLTKKFQTDKPEYVYNNNNKKYSVHWVPCGQSGDSSIISSNIEPSGYYEGYVYKLKEMIQIAINNEIQRLTIECTLHSYEERYKTNIKELVSAICGVESIDKHMASVAKRKRYLTGVLEGNRSISINY